MKRQLIKNDLDMLSRHLHYYIIRMKRLEKLRRIDIISKNNERVEKLIDIKNNSND